MATQHVTATKHTPPTPTAPKTDPSATQGQRDPSTVTSLNIDVTRCDVKSGKGRRCILSGDHKLYAAGAQAGNAFTETIDGHLYSSPHAKRELKPIAGKLLFDDVPDAEKIAAKRETVRSPEQMEIDRRVKAAHDAWVEAKRPALFADAPQKRIMFEPGNEDAVRAMLDRAGTFHGVSVRVQGPKSHTSGARMFYYVVMDRRERRSNASDAGSATATSDAEG